MREFAHDQRQPDTQSRRSARPLHRRQRRARGHAEEPEHDRAGACSRGSTWSRANQFDAQLKRSSARASKLTGLEEEARAAAGTARGTGARHGIAARGQPPCIQGRIHATRHHRTPARQIGIAAPAVRVEVHLASGLPRIAIVGLPETAVRESKDRVRSALLNSQFRVPARRITINLAPADLPKEGGRFDLPIALGILAASGQIDAGALRRLRVRRRARADRRDLRPVRGALPPALACRARRPRADPAGGNAAEAALVAAPACFRRSNLLQVCAHLNGSALIAPEQPRPPPRRAPDCPDLADVRGPAARQARAGDRRRRRPQPADDRPARHRQDHARQRACPASCRR